MTEHDRDDPDAVHLSDWNGFDPEITIVCDPEWVQSSNEPVRLITFDAFTSEDGRRYTFDPEYVTCNACLAWERLASGAVG